MATNVKFLVEIKRKKVQISRNTDFLCDNLLVNVDLLNRLVSQDVLDWDDRERVENAETSRDKVKKLTEILQKKEWKTDTYDCLRECLYKDHKFIVKTIESTVVEDREVQDSSMLIVEALSTYLVRDKDGAVSVEEIRQKLESINLHVTVRELTSCIQKAFPGLQIQPKKKGKKNTQTIYGLAVKSSSSGSPRQTEEISSSKSVEDEKGTPFDIGKWTINDVCMWLKSQNADERLITFVQEEDIAGDVFVDLTVEEIRREIPGIKLGHIKRIFKSLEEIKQKHIHETNQSVSQKTTEETYRPFDRPVGPLMKYRHGAKLPITEERCDKLLTPVHRYVQMTNVSLRDQPIEFGYESVKFACGCLNERCNGTIHFGVSTLQIEGLKLNKREYSDALTNSIEQAFREDQQQIAKSCIRTPKYIEVINTESEDELYVVEVDIVPQYTLVKDEIFYIRFAKSKSRHSRGVLCSLEGVVKDEGHFLDNVKSLAILRRDLESKHVESVAVDEDLSTKLVRLLCRGDENMYSDCYPILVINRPHSQMDMSFISEHFSFLKQIEWKAVFDLDSASSGQLMRHFVDETLEVALKLYTTDDFDPDSKQNKKQSRLKNIKEDIKSSTQIPWIYVNDFDEIKPLTAVDWKRQRITGFRECVRFFSKDIPKGRAIVVHLVLSKPDEVMNEVVDGFCSTFADQWMMICETPELCDLLLSEMQRRNIADTKTLNGRSVVGMPWGHVNSTVTYLTGSADESACELPSSTGSVITLREKIRNEFCDIEILGKNQCSNSDIMTDEIKLKCHAREVEEKFYIGGTVDWWNFWFRTHVLRRYQYTEMLRQITSALSPKGMSDYVTSVTLYHQPGAGGTTVARNILWDLRSQYRCAVVNNITSNTSLQIKNLHRYGEKFGTPKPVLLLLDNCDDDKVENLQHELENVAKEYARSHDEIPKIFYVLLLCSRRIQMRGVDGSKYVIIKHELKEDERQWFHKKSEDLEREYPDLDAKLLISFNILKENFNKRYMTRVVSDVIKDIHKKKERCLLKYIALLNTYDLHCQPIPVSAFDILMDDEPFSNVHPSNKKLWDNHLSPSFRILLNEPLKRGIGNIRTFRIINSILSKFILDELRGEDTVADVMSELLNSSIFSGESKAVSLLLKTVRDVMKSRPRKPDGRPEMKFSHLLTEMMDDNVQKAVDLLERVYEISDDPYIAQQIARLYLHFEKFEEAEQAAKTALSCKGDSSYILDTLGQVYKAQVSKAYGECVDINGRKYEKDWTRVNPSQALHVVKVARKAIDVFKKEQRVSETESTKAEQNPSGYLGEIDVVVQLLDYLTYLDTFEKRGDLHKYLVEDCIPPELNEWNDVDDVNYNIFLKSLYDSTDAALRRLEDETLQLKSERQGKTFEDKFLMRLRESICRHFGENDYTIPDHLSILHACEYRRRLILRTAGTSLRNIYDLRREERSLLKVRNLAETNIELSPFHHYDYKTLISVNLALSSEARLCKYLTPDCFNSMAKYSSQYYRQNEDNANIDAYLFYTLFNWPRTVSSEISQYAPSKWSQVFAEWKEAYYTKYPRQRMANTYRKKDSVLFFLGNGEGMESIAHYAEFQGTTESKGTSKEDFWNTHIARQRLLRSNGILKEDGTEVQISLPSTFRTIIQIPTSFPIYERTWWNKRVYFVVGFSFAGPKAYDISIEKPYLGFDNDQTTETGEGRRVRREYQRDETHFNFLEKLEEINRKLEEIGKLEAQEKDTTLGKQNGIAEKEDKLKKERDQLIAKRKRLLQPLGD